MDHVELRPSSRKGAFPYGQLQQLVKQDSQCRRILPKDRPAVESACEYCWEAPEKNGTVYFDVTPKVAGGFPRAESPTEAFLEKWATWARALRLTIVDDKGNELPLEDYLGARMTIGKMPKPRKKRARAYSPRERYAEGDMISHKKFGAGTVESVIGNTIEVKFESGSKKLAHGQVARGRS
jgi:hypothetical protein